MAGVITVRLETECDTSVKVVSAVGKIIKMLSF